MNLRDYPDRIVLACCIWGEARNQPVQGQIAVGAVVRNRILRSLLHAAEPASWKDVILKPWQFSCFNEGHPNLPKVQRAGVALMTMNPPADLKQALWIADGIISGAAQDVTKGATHYLTRKLLMEKPPAWAKDQPILVTIADHVFLAVA
jgi:spore germination cell wall hydrolase CwlJ-like protein